MKKHLIGIRQEATSLLNNAENRRRSSRGVQTPKVESSFGSNSSGFTAFNFFSEKFFLDFLFAIICRNIRLTKPVSRLFS